MREAAGAAVVAMGVEVALVAAAHLEVVAAREASLAGSGAAAEVVVG